MLHPVHPKKHSASTRPSPPFGGWVWEQDYLWHVDKGDVIPGFHGTLIIVHLLQTLNYQAQLLQI